MELKKAVSPIPLYIMAALMLLGTAASVTLSALALSNGSSALRLIEERLPRQEDGETKEDGVVIAESYTIRPTTQISDAYRSGDASALSDKQLETLDMASAVLEEIVTDGMTPFEKERAVYDWMTHCLQQDRGLLTVIPTTQADCDDPYGVLKYHNAVCVGYATTFRLFMEMLGIPCKVIHNAAMYHTWDLVELDGEWYHTDIYSDAGRGQYNCFNLTDLMMSARGQDWDTSYFPAATGLKYNMAFINSTECGDIFDFPARLRAALDNGDGMLSLRLGSDLTEHQALLLSEMADRSRSLLWDLPEYSSLGMSHFFTRLDDGYLFVMDIIRYDEGGDEAERLTEEELEAVAASVNGAFADLLLGQEEETDGWSGDDPDDWTGGPVGRMADG